jgi:hypothetical protein
MGVKKVGLHPAAVRQSSIHPWRCLIDPKAKRCHDAFDDVKDRLLPLKQTAPHLLDPPTHSLCVDLRLAEASLAKTSHARDPHLVTKEPASRASRSRLIAVATSAVLIIGLAIVRLIADDSPGADWVLVGPVQDVRAQGVVPLREIHAYVVMDPPARPIGLLARSPHLGEPIVYCTAWPGSP